VAKEIIIGCRRYKATELLPLGLLHQVVKKEALLPTARALAENLASKNPNAVMVSKATINALTFGNSVVRPDLLLTRE
jgi:enoyl-CoA hydratase